MPVFWGAKENLISSLQRARLRTTGSDPLPGLNPDHFQARFRWTGGNWSRDFGRATDRFWGDGVWKIWRGLRSNPGAVLRIYIYIHICLAGRVQLCQLRLEASHRNQIRRVYFIGSVHARCIHHCTRFGKDGRMVTNPVIRISYHAAS